MKNTEHLHPKVLELKRRSSPFTKRASVDASGKLIDFRADAGDSDNRIVKCYLSVWGVRDTYGTIMVKGCCSKSISERGPKSGANQKIAHLWMHYQDEPLGQYTVLKEDDYGLYAEIAYDDIPEADRALKQLRSKTLNQFSIGFNYLWDKVEYDEEQDALILKEIDLMEGSVVTFGSNDQTGQVRTPEQLANAIDEIQERAEYFIRSIPRRQQLELRTILADYKALYEIKEPSNEASLKELKTAAQRKTVELGMFKDIDLSQL